MFVRVMNVLEFDYCLGCCKYIWGAKLDVMSVVSGVFELEMTTQWEINFREKENEKIIWCSKAADGCFTLGRTVVTAVLRHFLFFLSNTCQKKKKNLMLCGFFSW